MIATCERLFLDERKRYSTDNIGLARLGEGLELVRIGEPLRPEYAAWRYGDQFKRRFYRRTAYKMTGAAVPIAYFAFGVPIGMIGVAAFVGWSLGSIGWDILRDRRIVARIEDGTGANLVIRGGDAALSSLVPGERDDESELKIPKHFGFRERVIFGDAARRAAALVVPHFNRGGGTKKTITRATERLEELGPHRYLAWAARNQPPSWFAFDYWLAMEMAVNEENERHALANELHHLEDSWKAAEELAGIADKLFLPATVEEKFATLRSKRSSGSNL